MDPNEEWEFHNPKGFTEAHLLFFYFPIIATYVMIYMQRMATMWLLLYNKTFQIVGFLEYSFMR